MPTTFLEGAGAIPHTSGAWRLGKGMSISYDPAGDGLPILNAGPRGEVILYDLNGLLTDPNADHTGVVQAAIDNLALQGGGTVVLPWQRVNITQLRMKTRITLDGGGWATELFQIANSVNDIGGPLHMIILDNPDVEHAVVKNLRMHGNKANQTTANDGIYYDNIGGSWTTNDQLHVVQNVFIDSCKGNGVSRGPAVREMRIIDTHATRCDGRGIHVPGAGGTDNWIISCTASACGLSGFRAGYFDRHIGCKAFGNGLLGVEDDRSGFVADGVGEMFSGCDAQENSGPGWLLHGARGCTFADCSATSNQQEGWLIKASSNNLLFVTSGSVNGHAWIQTMDFKFEGGSEDNEIHINNQGFDFPASNPWDEVGKETNRVVLNRHLRGVQYNLEGDIGQDTEHFSWGKEGAGANGIPYYTVKTDVGAVPGGVIGSWDGSAFRTYMILDHPNSRLLLGDPASVPDVLIIAPRLVMPDGVIASHDGVEGSTDDEHFIWGKAGSPLHYALKSDPSAEHVSSIASWDGDSGHTFLRFNHSQGRVYIGATGDTEAVWGGTLVPENPDTQDLGSASSKWRDAWLNRDLILDGSIDGIGDDGVTRFPMMRLATGNTVELPTKVFTAYEHTGPGAYTPFSLQLHQTDVNTDSVQLFTFFARTTHPSGTSGTLSGINGSANHNGAGGLGELRAYHGRPGTGSSFSGTVTNAVAFHAAQATFDGTGVITNYFAFDAQNRRESNPGTATVTNYVGLRVEELTGGSNNWAIITEGQTPSAFGGDVEIGGHVLPMVGGAKDIGSNGTRWRDLWISGDAHFGGSIRVGNYISAGGDADSAGGLSLWSAATEDNVGRYGITFRSTSGWGGYGSINGTHAMYFGTDNTNRGWIFRHTVDGNVASISGAGNAWFKGDLRVTVGDVTGEIFIGASGNAPSSYSAYLLSTSTTTGIIRNYHDTGYFVVQAGVTGGFLSRIRVTGRSSAEAGAIVFETGDGSNTVKRGQISGAGLFEWLDLIQSVYGNTNAARTHFMWGRTGSPAAGNPSFRLGTNAAGTPAGQLLSTDGTNTYTYLHFFHEVPSMTLGAHNVGIRTANTIAPNQDNVHDCGIASLRWKLVRGVTITPGDLAWEEIHDHITKEPFLKDDFLTMIVKEMDEDPVTGEILTRTVPVLLDTALAKSGLINDLKARIATLESRYG